MKSPSWSEDERLGRWVGEVTRRWAATGLPPRRRRNLFARLLGWLAHARARGTITSLTSSDPTAFADTTAQEWWSEEAFHPTATSSTQ